MLASPARAIDHASCTHYCLGSLSWRLKGRCSPVTQTRLRGCAYVRLHLLMPTGTTATKPPEAGESNPTSLRKPHRPHILLHPHIYVAKDQLLQRLTSYLHELKDDVCLLMATVYRGPGRRRSNGVRYASLGRLLRVLRLMPRRRHGSGSQPANPGERASLWKPVGFPRGKMGPVQRKTPPNHTTPGIPNAGRHRPNYWTSDIRLLWEYCHAA